MLRTRIIPVILIDGFSVLKTIGFEARRNLGSPITVVRTYNTRNVDELIILDIDASKSQRKIDLFTIKDLSSECFMPLSIGGGIKSCGDIQETLLAGADKVVLNSILLDNPEFLQEAAALFGRQCLVASVDVLRVDNHYCIYDHRDRSLREVNIQAWLQKLEHLGAGEILVNSVADDGSLNGVDTVLVSQAASAVNIPLVYAGGVSEPNDCVELVSSGAHAVAASSIFHFTRVTPQECKECMAEKSIQVRL